MPFRVLLDEAVDLARFFRTYYPTVRDAAGTVIRHGLDSVAGPGRRLSASSGEELLSLRDAVQEAQSRYLLTLAPRDRSHEARACVVLREIRSALKFLFDDGVQDVADAQLEQLSTTSVHRSRSSAAVALDLHHHATLAAQHRTELHGLGGFDAALIDEAFALAERGMGIRQGPSPAPSSPGSTEALDLRNRLIRLLADRMGILRGAAGFVFRGSPEIVREATSTYERRRRSASRRAAAGKVAASRGAPSASPDDPTPKPAASSILTATAAAASEAPPQKASSAVPSRARRKRRG